MPTVARRSRPVAFVPESVKPPACLRWRPSTHRPALGLFVLALLAGGGLVRGETGGWLERLQERLDSLETFRARFVQEYEPRAFSRRQRETGTVTFQRPGKMRWDYDWPEPKLALSDGASVWVYYPEERRADVQPLALLGEGAPAVQILMGRWRLRERFRVQSLERGEGEVTLSLVPRDESTSIKTVRITLAESGLVLRAVEAEEAGGNILRYRFEDWQEGIETAAESFTFTPPEGTRVQELR